MHDELTARQRAIRLRLAGRSVNAIGAALGRVKAWFHKWWGRYLQAGPEGLYDLTRANHHVAQRISPELERTILSIRRRLLSVDTNWPELRDTNLPGEPARPACQAFFRRNLPSPEAEGGCGERMPPPAPPGDRGIVSPNFVRIRVH